jgi:hypothetical protein
LSDVLVATMLEPPLRAMMEETADQRLEALLTAVEELFRLKRCDAPHRDPLGVDY